MVKDTPVTRRRQRKSLIIFNKWLSAATGNGHLRYTELVLYFTTTLKMMVRDS